MVNLGWSISTMIIIWLLFSQYNITRKNYVFDIISLTNFVVIGQILWALAQCWVIFACYTNNGGIIFILWNDRMNRERRGGIKLIKNEFLFVYCFRRNKQIPFSSLVRCLQQDIVLVVFNTIFIFFLRGWHHQISGSFLPI